MAAILTHHLRTSAAGLPTADARAISRVTRRRSLDLSEILRSLKSVLCEGLLLLWMFAVVAFSMLMAAGAMGLVG